MIIQSSNISMQSAHLRTSIHQQQTSLSLWKDAPDSASQPEQPKLTPKPIAQQALAIQPTSSVPTEAVDEDSQLSPELFKMKQAIESLMAWMSGRTVKIKLFSEEDMQARSTATTGDNLSAPPANAQNAQANAANASAEWGFIYQESQQYAEMESLSVGMQGAVTTADGRSINFDLSLALSRSYYSESSLEVRAGAALKDPLVINFGGQPAQLTLNKVEFDLVKQEAGMESITQLAAGSVYLALDRNGNGKIDDGSELFGPNSGNGFAELAQLDEDGNGWIDEGDKIFSQLQIWQPNSDGSQSLTAIAKLGIGAIYSRGIDAPFDYKTADNQLQGQLKQAGVFLFEDGRSGSVQQIDLAV